MTHHPKVNGCVGSMAPTVPVVKTTIGKRQTKVKSYKQERGMTQIKEQLVPKVTTTTKVELWCQVEQPTKIPIVFLHTYVMKEEGNKEPQNEDLRRSKGKKARTQWRVTQI